MDPTTLAHPTRRLTPKHVCDATGCNSPLSTVSSGAEHERERIDFSVALAVQITEYLTGCLFNLVVPVLRGALFGVDEGRAIDLSEVAVREAITALGSLVRVLVDRQVPAPELFVAVFVDLVIGVVGGRRRLRPRRLV